MLVVSNTSPLSNLAIIGRLDLLREQLGELHIPPAVRAELDRHPDSEAKARLENAISADWIRVVGLFGPVPLEAAATLDAGEAEALARAVQLDAKMVLLDESAARAKAVELGLAHTGVLGILRHARRLGRIPSLKTEIQRLRSEVRFFVNPILERRLLISVGEE